MMRDLIEVFRMKELSIDVRCRIIKKLGTAINHTYAMNITEDLVDELITALESTQKQDQSNE
jgi:hypothetical protein